MKDSTVLTLQSDSQQLGSSTSFPQPSTTKSVRCLERRTRPSSTKTSRWCSCRPTTRRCLRSCRDSTRSSPSRSTSPPTSRSSSTRPRTLPARRATASGCCSTKSPSTSERTTLALRSTVRTRPWSRSWRAESTTETSMTFASTEEMKMIVLQLHKFLFAFL